MLDAKLNSYLKPLTACIMHKVYSSSQIIYAQLVCRILCSEGK